MISGPSHERQSLLERWTRVGPWLLVGGAFLRAAWLPTVAGRPVGTAIETLGVLLVLGLPILRGVRVEPLALVAGLLFLSPHGMGAGDPSTALQEMLAIALVVVVVGDPRRHRIRHELGRVAAVLVGVHALLYVGAWALALGTDVAALPVFELGHEKASGLPRFQGAARNPIGLGMALLCCVGFALALPRPRIRRVTIGVGLALCVATFSFATLLVPFVLLGHVRRRSLRRPMTAGVIVAALAALYLTPRSIEGAAFTWHSAADDAVGLSELDIELASHTLTVRTTAYLELAQGAIVCFQRHPLAGVGPGAFASRCPVRASDTLGRVGPHVAHNELLALGAERGLWGLASFALLVGVFARRYRIAHPSRARMVWALLLCTIVKVILHVPIVALLIATSLRRRSHTAR